MSLMNTEKEGTFKKSGGRQVSTRLKNFKPLPATSMDFGERFDDYDRGRAGTIVRGSISMSQAPKLSMHKNKNALFGLGKKSILEKKSFLQGKIEVT